MKKVLGRMSGILFAVFCIAILGMMMSFTWGALTRLFPDSFTNRLWGMVMFDIAAMAWALAFVFKSESLGQYAAAGIGFIVGFLGTLLMVAAEVIMGGQSFVQNNSMGQYMVYGFIIVTVIHAGLVYLHHGSAPDIHQKINVGIARGEIETEAIRQATESLDIQKAMLASTIHSRIVDDVKRDLNLPVAVDPNVGFVPADPAQLPLYPVQAQPKAEKKPSWIDRMKVTLGRPAGTGMVKNEQTIVQQVELDTPAKPSVFDMPCGHTKGVVMNSNADGYQCRECGKPVALKEDPKPGNAPFPHSPAE